MFILTHFPGEFTPVRPRSRVSGVALREGATADKASVAGVHRNRRERWRLRGVAREQRDGRAEDAGGEGGEGGTWTADTAHRGRGGGRSWPGRG